MADSVPEDAPFDVKQYTHHVVLICYEQTSNLDTQTCTRRSYSWMYYLQIKIYTFKIRLDRTFC
jgi:hypothetical protein